jgi:peptidoglycan-associated lipoprotein
MRKTLMTILAGMIGGTAAWAQTAVQPIATGTGSRSTSSADTTTTSAPVAWAPMAGAKRARATAVAAAPAPAEPATTDTATVDTDTDTVAAIEPTADFDELTILFDFDSSDPKDASELSTAKAWIASHPDHFLVIEGHTDPVGSFDYNAGLATRRAETVRSELLDLGADADRLVVGVYGENKVISDDDAQNRRVIVRGSNQSLDEITKAELDEGLAVVWSYEPSPEAVATRERKTRNTAL